LAAAERLGDFPHIGHAGLAPGTYEWPVTGLPYILVHEVYEEDKEVVILAVFHGAQDRQQG
jgi:plasmid stabilization system protein ParE